MNRKLLIVLDVMVKVMKANKKNSPIVTELFFTYFYS